MRKSAFHTLVYGNIATVVCIFFTIATMLDLALCVSVGIWDISYRHLGMRFIICIAATLSLAVFRWFENVSLLVIYAIHFFVCIVIMLLFTWTSSLYSEIHPNAYRDAVRTIFYIYPVITLGGFTIDYFQTAKANRILKKNKGIQ